MKNLAKGILGLAAALSAFVPASHGQTTTIFNAAGSSALFLELGQAAYQTNKAAGACVWSGTSGVTMTDTSTGSSKSDTGSAWVVWVHPSGFSCGSNRTPTAVYAYLQTDSVVGNRCLFNSQASNSCNVSYSAAIGSAGAGLIGPTFTTPITEAILPSAVAAVLDSSKVNVAGTDIRPEDAAFATLRALTSCGSSTTGTGGSIAPYLGLGYSNGDDILSSFSSKTFHVINFTLPSTYFVQPVGVDPMMVVVNSTDASGTGFNNSAITNITRAQLALYLDGSLGTTDPLVPVGTSNTPASATVIVREPLSGTYNTMEYNVPNTVMMGTSQDVGVNQLPSQVNCSGTVPGSNPMNITNSLAGSVRKRAIGTGEELKQVFNNNDTLGYGFWGLSNFASAPTSARYLKVDNADPIRSAYTGGTIPTSSSSGGIGYSGISFGQVQNGTYPIWSLIRLVTVDSTTAAAAKQLAIGVAQFSTSGHPDFLTYYTSKGVQNIQIERSHFAPPGITLPTAPANGGKAYPNGVGNCTAPEAGGDVGGVILNITSTDQPYCTETGLTTGIVGRRY